MMQREDFRREIVCLFKYGHGAKKIKEFLDNQYGEGSPSLTTVYKWIWEAKRGKNGVNDAPRSGRPVSTNVAWRIEKVRELVSEQPRVSVRRLEQLSDIPKEVIRNILTKNLNMVKMNCRWVPKELSNAQRSERVRSCKSILATWERSWSELTRRLVTSDETWVNYETSHDRISGGEWRKRGSKPPELPKIPNNRKKIMATVFWDSQGILLLDVLPSGQTVTSQYYADLLCKLREEIKNKRRGKLAKGVIMLDDNARVHTAKTVQEQLRKFKWTRLDHPPYSPDLAPSDFYLFKFLKNFLKGTNFTEKEELESEITAFLMKKVLNFSKKLFWI